MLIGHYFQLITDQYILSQMAETSMIRPYRKVKPTKKIRKLLSGLIESEFL